MSKGRKPYYAELKEQRVRKSETEMFDVNREILSDILFAYDADDVKLI